MQAFREVEVQLHTHTHTLNLSTTVNGHEWSASCHATLMLGGNLNWHGQFGIKKNLFPCQESKL